jgi:hypothetical protein
MKVGGEVSFVDPKPDEENEACPQRKPKKPRPSKKRKRKPNPPTGHLPPLDQLHDEETSQTPPRPRRRCAKCGERALAETVRAGRCLGCQVEAYLDTL